MERRRIATGMLDLDVALGGWTSLGEMGFQMEWGMERPSTVLLSAEPGAGASTLMQQIAAYVAAHNGSSRGVLYISGDESVDALAVRGRRLHADHQLVWARHVETMRGVEESVAHYGPVMTIVDTVQAMRLPEHENSVPENTLEHQIAVAKMGASLAQAHNTCVWLVNRTTKTDPVRAREVATDERLKHEVDVSMWMHVEQYPETGRRLSIRTDKNRFSAISR